MAIGFKVADAYVAVHTEDDTKRGRDKIHRDSDKWSLGLGNLMGGNMLRGITRGLLGVLGVLTKITLLVSKMALLGLAAGAAATAVAGLLGYVVQLLPVISQLASVAVAAAGALLLFPAVIATVLTAVLTLKLGFQGLGAALKAGLAGDAEALAEALKKLAPNAADFVNEVIKIKPAFDRVRLQIQNSLFADLADLLRRMAEVYLPIINDGLDRMAQVINRVFKSIGAFLLGANTQADMATILANAATAAGNLAAALRPALEILRDVLVVSTGVAAELTANLGPIFQGWADTIAQMRADGSLAKLITDGLDALKTFGALAMDILGIVKGIFGAAGQSGGLFSFFDRLNKLINSVEGQANLTAIFSALATAANALTPVLVILLRALVPIIMGISEIAVAFSPGLQVFAEQLGLALRLLVPAIIALNPLLQILASALVPIAKVLAGLVATATPGLVKFFEGLSAAIDALAPAALFVGQALGDFLAALAPLLGPIGQLLAFALSGIATGLEGVAQFLTPTLAGLAKQLGEAFARMAPILLDIAANVLPDLVTAGLLFAGAFAQVMIDKMPQLIVLMGLFVDLLTKFANEAGERFIQAIIDILPLLPSLVQSFIDLSASALAFLKALEPFYPLIEAVLTNPAGILALIGALEILAFTLSISTMWLQLAGALFTWLKDMIFGAKGGVESFGTAVQDSIGNAMGIFRNLGAAIYNAIGNLSDLLWNAGYNLIQGLIRGIRAAIPNLSGVMGWIANMVRSYWPFSPAKTGPLSGKGDLLYAGQNLVGRLVEGVRSEMQAAQNMAADLAGLFQIGGAGSLAGAGAAGAAGSLTTGPIYVQVQIGDKPVREMVKGEIVSNPQMVSGATNEGNRLDTFTSGRKRIGDT